MTVFIEVVTPRDPVALVSGGVHGDVPRANIDA